MSNTERGRVINGTLLPLMTVELELSGTWFSGIGGWGRRGNCANISIENKCTLGV